MEMEEDKKLEIVNRFAEENKKADITKLVKILKSLSKSERKELLRLLKDEFLPEKNVNEIIGGLNQYSDDYLTSNMRDDEEKIIEENKN